MGLAQNVNDSYISQEPVFAFGAGDPQGRPVALMAPLEHGKGHLGPGVGPYILINSLITCDFFKVEKNYSRKTVISQVG